MVVSHVRYRALDTSPIYMAVEDIHKDRDTSQRLITQAHFNGWRDVLNQGHDAIRWADNQILTLRYHTRGVTEEVVSPNGQPNADPKQSLGNQSKN